MVGGGESGCIVPDPSDPNILFASGVYGSVVRWDRRTSLSQDITPWPMPNFGSRDRCSASIALRGRRCWSLSPLEKNALYLGTQYVMKTTDGGLHWKQDQSRPDRREPSASGASRQVLPTAEHFRRQGARLWRGVQHRAFAMKAGEIWAGSDTGLLHLTRDGGKNWKTSLLRAARWSKIAMIEASRFDPAVAYVAVDRHRLDDQKPYISIARATMARRGSRSPTASAAIAFRECDP